jgi:hypothetical protein
MCDRVVNYINVKQHLLDFQVLEPAFSVKPENRSSPIYPTAERQEKAKNWSSLHAIVQVLIRHCSEARIAGRLRAAISTIRNRRCGLKRLDQAITTHYLGHIPGSARNIIKNQDFPNHASFVINSPYVRAQIASLN